jgi:parvulin-like peptidyl-prolyl isomerase
MRRTRCATFFRCVGQAPGLRRPLRPPCVNAGGAESPAQAEGLSHKTSWVVMLLAFLAPFGMAEIIDRIAVAVDKNVITESEVFRQIRITAFLNNEQPDFSPANKRATADRLVEQLLIRRELESTGYSSPASPSDSYEELLKRYKSQDEYRQALEKYGIQDADVRKALEWQVTLLEFVDLRFRPGVQIAPSEIKEYYDVQSTLNPGKLPAFEQAKDDIEKILMSQRVDNALDRWLGQARTQSRIRYMQEVFR